VIVAAVALREVRRIAELLLVDVSTHGSETGASIDFELKAVDSDPCLEVVIRNIVRDNDKPGQHRSQGQVADIARRNGLSYYHDTPKAAGAPFVSRLVFPHVWYLET
jgi:hypothetical protein